ncbi:uncharacterized protein BKCO1_3000118 [Diplodia corticola]|uniref:Uncharacterized protein n=1 Tax=Diplodia corticola TaxID=236234 RepID=A0A1J9RBE8_9PEZI|nr:uncharacterized protein BKCO1_3000118 [Diplodia corticola]OJD38934.1 hypothetical protein BKCO1_3000118 [Diplodia corticola]
MGISTDMWTVGGAMATMISMVWLVIVGGPVGRWLWDWWNKEARAAERAAERQKEEQKEAQRVAKEDEKSDLLGKMVEAQQGVLELLRRAEAADEKRAEREGEILKLLRGAEKVERERAEREREILELLRDAVWSDAVEQQPATAPSS